MSEINLWGKIFQTMIWFGMSFIKFCKFTDIQISQG